ncbi:MAG: hypothetical protein D6739_12375 [Nitrospirae bacterium]|nr:MAG: hypothetical protein D6739_12375 [Nitrospirota bacterium]
MSRLAALLLLAALLATPAGAAEPLLLVVDASPSMARPPATPPPGVAWWQTLLHRLYGLAPPPPPAASRLALVRAALDRYLEALPEGLPVGLRLFGQRRWKGCEDSRLLVPPVNRDRGRVRAALARLQAAPEGRTPLAFAVTEGLRDLLPPEVGGRGHLLVLSDAADLCPGPLPDARAVAERLGVVARVDLILLGAPEAATRERLAPLAEPTGGAVYGAAGLAEVEIALRRARPITGPQRAAAALHLHPGSWPAAVATGALLCLALLAWPLVRSER